MKGESPLLTKVLVAIVADLSKRPNSKLLSSEALAGIVDVAVGAVAANSDLVSDTIDEEWLSVLIKSVTSTIANAGIRESFSEKGLESMLLDTLGTFSKHPELIIERPGLAQEILQGILASLSEVDTLAAEELASAAVGGSLAGVTITNVMQEVIKALARSGKTAVGKHPAGVLAGQLEEVLTAGLSRAETELGSHLSLSTLPDVPGELVVKWGRGEIETIDPNNDNFRRLFDEIAERTAA